MPGETEPFRQRNHSGKAAPMPDDWSPNTATWAWAALVYDDGEWASER